MIEPPLPQAAGYAVVVAVGFFIAFLMILVTILLRRTAGEDNRTTEMFMTANRSVGTGLTASAVISSWLWSTAMLGSTFVGYNFGVAGPFWFAAGYVSRPLLPSVVDASKAMLLTTAQMLPYDCILRSARHCVQNANSRSAHTTRDRPHPLRHRGPRGVDLPMPHQQHHCRCEYASRSQCGHLSSVSAQKKRPKGWSWVPEGDGH